MSTMRTVMSSTPTSSEVSTSRSIAWSNDDPYAQAMGRPEYSGRVRGVRSGILPTRSTSCSSATPANQDEVSVLRARLAALEAAQAALEAAQAAMVEENNAWVAAQDARIADQETRLTKMQQLIESLISNQGAMGNQPAANDRTS